MSTFDSQHTDLSTSTVSSAERFRLNPTSKSDILVYRVRGGYKVTKEADLCRELDEGGDQLRLTRKFIPKSQSRLNILAKDLQYDEEQRAAEEMRNPNQTASIASIGLPHSIRIRRMFGQFEELYIVSQNSSKSLASSQGSSAWESVGNSGANSPENGPTRHGTGDVVQAEAR